MPYKLYMAKTHNEKNGDTKRQLLQANMHIQAKKVILNKIID